MAKSSFMCQTLWACLLLRLVLLVKATSLAPALYVFGDSTVDSGNNNYLKTLAKVNYKPYGIDFPLGATGRFTNGKAIADFLAELLGLPFAPPYMGLSDTDRSNHRIITGVNYASGSAGILPETGRALGENLNLDDQIKYFQDTVSKDLPKLLKNTFQLSHYLSNSIFLVSIGNNDYLNNYLQPANYNSSKIYTPQQFAHLLLEAFKQRLTKLYSLGARKFVVIDLSPLGCLPAVVNAMNPKPKTPCAEDVNQLVSIYNAAFSRMILQLQLHLSGSTFVKAAIYRSFYDANQNPSKYGFSAGRAPCCEINGTSCIPNKTPCEDRTTHMYWDSVHPTQQVYTNLAIACFSGSATCIPINVKQLALKP